MAPSVSVIMPVYNGENVIADAIKSVLNQSLPDFELIIIDDCSIDNTAIIVQRFARQNEQIVFIRNDNNLGAATSRNIGCKRARGKYIAFLDCDDLWDTNKLDKQVSFMVENKSDLSYTSYEFMDKEGCHTGKYYYVPESISYNVILCSTVMINASIFKDYEFDNGYFHEDYRLWLELLRNGKKAEGINEVLSLYRSGGRSSNRLRAAKNRWLIYRKAEGLPFLKSLRYFVCYAYYAIIKYYIAIL